MEPAHHPDWRAKLTVDEQRMIEQATQHGEFWRDTGAGNATLLLIDRLVRFLDGRE